MLIKKLLIIPLLLISFVVSATNYYIKSGGNDANTGLSDDQAWATITKINTVWAAGTFAPDDSILFKCGDTFYGSLTCTEGGTSGHPITVGAYGTGAKPVITGLTTVTGWTLESGTIYKKVIATQSALHMLLIDGVPYNIGRYPKGLVYKTIDSHVLYTSITDAELPDESIYNFTGADLIRVCSPYRISSEQITNHTNTTLTHVVSEDSSQVGYGYFIQNSILCLQMPDATFGEWYYNTTTSTLYVNFDQNPEGLYNVQIATIDDIVKFTTNRHYITFDGLYFYGNNHACINLINNDYITVKNCDLYYSGYAAIKLSTGSVHVTIDNNVIHHANNLGISSYYAGSHYLKISNNTINNIGLFIACGKRYEDYDADLDGSWTGGSAICANGDDYSLIEYNRLTNLGYLGMFAGGTNTVVRNNFIDNILIYEDDGGGIYTSTGDDCQGMKIYKNFILNSRGTLTGHGNTTMEGSGIYTDQTIDNNIEIYENVIYNSTFGIMPHSSQYQDIHDNLVYDCLYGLRVATGTDTTCINLTIKNNQFIAKKATEYAARYIVGTAYDFTGFGVIDSNIYARPIDDDYSISTWIYKVADQYYDVSGWKTVSGEDAHSTASLAPAVASEDDIHFIYNDTTVNKSFTLSSAMKDVTNASYSGTIELLPYTGLVLLGEGTVTEGGSIPDPPAPSGTVFLKNKAGTKFLKNKAGTKCLKIN